MVICSSSALALGFLCQSVGLIRLPVLLDPSNLVASFTSLGKMSLPRQQHRLLNTRLIGPTSVLGIDKTSLEKKFVVEFIIIPLFLFQSLSFKGKITPPFHLLSIEWVEEQNKILKN